jgi:hypothetical protein
LPFLVKPFAGFIPSSFASLPFPLVFSRVSITRCAGLRRARVIEDLAAGNGQGLVHGAAAQPP